jgi:hypothetical protein
MGHLERKMTVNDFVLNVVNRTQCPEHPQSGTSALSVINEPMTVAPDLAIFVFEVIATLIIMRILYLDADVKFVTL